MFSLFEGAWGFNLKSSVGGDGARTRRSASSKRRARRGPARKLAKDAGQFPSVQTRHCGTTHQFQTQKLSFYFHSRPHHRAQAKALRELALVCPKGQEGLRADGSKLPVRCYPCAFRNCLVHSISIYASTRGAEQSLALTSRGSLVVENEAVCRPLNHVIRTQAGLDRRKGHLQ